MPPTPPKMRDIVKTKRYETDLQAIIGNVEKADEFLEGVELIISRDPQAGTCMGPSSHVWFIPGHTVDVAIYYTFDNDRVYLLSARKTLPPEI
jgi:hypothetical protein